MNITVCGAGGFIGGHLTAALLYRKHKVRAVDIKPFREWFQVHDHAESLQRTDLTNRSDAYLATQDVDLVINLAADMGGMGYIANHHADCMLSVLSSTHLLMGAAYAGVPKYFFASSACIYPDYLQTSTVNHGLKESDAYPALCEDGYGWEKLFGERLCANFAEDFDIEVRVARYHNVYGPHGTWRGGREKAPAAICRKVAEAVLHGTDEIEIWGDGEQTRSFMYIEDCIAGTLRLIASGHGEPVNLGSDRLVSINELVDIVETIAGTKLRRRYVEGPQGVRGRNSDNTLARKVLEWEPQVSLEAGLAATYEWIFEQVRADTIS